MTHRILVLGAGYAGLTAARRAARRGTGTRVTLVNAAPDFVERIRLHQVAAGQETGTRPLAEMVGDDGVDLVVGRAERWDTARREVDVRSGAAVRTLTYDTLVLALGSTAGSSPVPGADEHALTVAGLDGARAVAERVAADPAGRVAVVGGGLTGIETATELAESHPGLEVALVTRGGAAPGLGPRGRVHVRRSLARLGVALREYATVAEVDADGLLLDDDARIPADLVVWNGGFSVSAFAREAGLAVDGDGRAVVDATFRSVSHPEVYVIGDAARADDAWGRPLRMSCAMGLPMAVAAADALTGRIQGREPATAPFGYTAQCVSLGRRDGLVQLVRGDDSPRGAVLTGRGAARFKEATVAGAVALPAGGMGQMGLYLSAARFMGRRGPARTVSPAGAWEAGTVRSE
ncbi:NAD(P)/FAD-dependent oxidoreductase [Nocardiopsis sp. CNT312]|uniref:NAD(P)/FAD-dependent oxidoreductase n=1 Tax=Nocardiopsis sp. CNT312 TaxID=1137268 RepID=UPI0004B8CD72|nr:FAD-dependent oxidoreductase [Nocardiopsis sp. CNT312]